jgi:hypothetical protein
MPQNIVEFKEAAGKTVQKITATNEADWRCITIRFTDLTSLHFTIRPRIEFDPELVDWKTGDGKQLKQFPTVPEHDEDPPKKKRGKE